VSIPFPSFAFQTLTEMMVIMMVLVLNMRNLRERSTLMAMVVVRHKELERQIINMMAMAIIDLGKQEKTMIRTIYKHE
jgi:hypothetical protein